MTVNVRLNRFDGSFVPVIPDQRGASVLVIGDLARWRSMGRLTINFLGCTFLDLTALNHQKIRQIAPDLVVSPLFTTGFDAVDVANTLSAAAYAGRYFAVANSVPDCEMIRREIRLVAPFIDFDLLVVPD